MYLETMGDNSTASKSKMSKVKCTNKRQPVRGNPMGGVTPSFLSLAFYMHAFTCTKHKHCLILIQLFNNLFFKDPSV